MDTLHLGLVQSLATGRRFFGEAGGGGVKSQQGAQRLKKHVLRDNGALSSLQTDHGAANLPLIS